MSKKPNIDLPRRFYREVGVREGVGGFQVVLDGRAPKSPAGAALVLPTKTLAALVAEEWDAQSQSITIAAMPATRLAFTAIDRVPQARSALAAEVAKYADADLLCYLAEGPSALVARQVERWGPLLDWARADRGVSLDSVTGVTHRAQSPEALARVEALAAALDDFALTALVRAAGLLGSAVLALALQGGRLTGQAAFDLSRLDETFQEERWGVDAEAVERAAGVRDEAILLERWFKALA